MIKSCIFIILFFLNLNFFIWSQENIKPDYITAVGELIKTKATGKRHNSFFFTFKIIELISGKTNDSIIVSQEVYNDFGAKQILSKIYSNKYLYNIKNESLNKVIIKFTRNKKGLYSLQWVSELHRQKSLENLERYLKAYFLKKQKKMYKSILLSENNGRLFFSDDEKTSKVAIETYEGSGNWIIALIEDWED